MAKNPIKRLTFSLENKNESFIDECIRTHDHKSLLIFLLQTLPNTLIKLNHFKGCIELYPLPSTLSEDFNSEPELSEDSDD